MPATFWRIRIAPAPGRRSYECHDGAAARPTKPTIVVDIDRDVGDFDPSGRSITPLFIEQLVPCTHLGPSEWQRVRS
jgi:hypothetical protein